jgi:hypothetical protein
MLSLVMWDNEQNFKDGHAIVTSLSSLMPGFYPKPADVMYKVTMGQVGLRVLHLSLVTGVPPELHIHISFMCSHYSTILAIDIVVK